MSRTAIFVSTEDPKGSSHPTSRSKVQAMYEVARDTALEHLLQHGWRVQHIAQQERGFHAAHIDHTLASPSDEAHRVRLGLLTGVEDSEPNVVTLEVVRVDGADLTADDRALVSGCEKAVHHALLVAGHMHVAS